uniref:Uncharacterized protein n=1 Tax=Panstrongylus lignarius TaxID=156445 RepID=A0A224XU81_9HEMI
MQVTISVTEVCSAIGVVVSSGISLVWATAGFSLTTFFFNIFLGFSSIFISGSCLALIVTVGVFNISPETSSIAGISIHSSITTSDSSGHKACNWLQIFISSTCSLS